MPSHGGRLQAYVFRAEPFSLGPAGLVGGQWPSLSTPPGRTGPGGHSCRSLTPAHAALTLPTCVNVASISADPTAQREGAAAGGPPEEAPGRSLLRTRPWDLGKGPASPHRTFRDECPSQWLGGGRRGPVCSGSLGESTRRPGPAPLPGLLTDRRQGRVSAQTKAACAVPRARGRRPHTCPR